MEEPSPTACCKVSKSQGHQWIYATDGHAPHLVNYVDVQRLIAGGAFDRERSRRGHEESEAAASCVPVQRVHYSPWCAGLTPWTPVLGGNAYTEAYFHYCHVDLTP